MLQSMRENLKGAVAVVVLGIFIVPLVLFGVDQLQMGSGGGNDVASVNGEDIVLRQLQREIAFDRIRMQQQMDLSETDPRLDDSALRGPALDRLVGREALLQEARKGGMGVDKDTVWRDIMQTDAFVVDGKFDYELFKQRISNFYTPATYLDATSKDYVLRQLGNAITNTAFVTDADLALIASITQQARTFYSIDIPKDSVGELVASDEDIQQYYEENTARYTDPEKLSVDYVTLSLDALAEQNPAPEADVKAAYDIEVAEFNADPKIEVAHILIEEGEDQATELQAVKDKLAAGETFEAVAEAHSDDLGSNAMGGVLGELVEDAFPETFVEAAKKLAAGEISEPIETDAGVHIIKVIDIANAQPPTFEERKAVLAKQLARQNALELYVNGMAKLDELTFGADNLEVAASELGLTVVTSDFFSRSGGAGIAASRDVVTAAYAEDVLEQGQNSRVLELAGDKAVVLRLNTHQEAAVKPLETVKASIKTQLETQKANEALQAKAEAVTLRLKQGVEPEALAKELDYAYVSHENVKRSNFEVDRALVTKVFSLPRPLGDAPVFESVNTADGFSIVGLISVTDGEVGTLTEQEVGAIKAQLGYQVGQTDMALFEQAVLAAADIEKSQ